MKILSTEQIKELDQYTIEHEPVSSIELMERAAESCVKRISKLVSREDEILVFCGKGNNGGDGLTITRLLKDSHYKATAFLIHYTDKFSPDADLNYFKLKEKYPEQIKEVNAIKEFPELSGSKTPVIIDALLGTGMNKPIEGLLSDAIIFINKISDRIISIDVPSGLNADKSSTENKYIVNAALCLTFQLPKLAFLLPGNAQFVPEFEILDIDLHPVKLSESSTPYHYVTKEEVMGLLKKRNKFSHKGTFGHALLLAGSKGKSGAAVIASKACLKSGAGLLTLHSTRDTLISLSNHLPEAMTHEDSHSDFITELEKPEDYNAIAFGPGVGNDEDTALVLKKLLNYYTGKLLIDADGLNILSENKTWLSFLPPNTILTPHLKEFERLTEKVTDDFVRLQILKQFSLKNNCIVILKGAHSAIAMPDGNVFFNSSGNAGLAKGGAGDGLTGIILGLLARGYNAPQSAIIGTFIHGLAADLCLKKKSMESILISDVIDMLPKAFKMLEK